MKLLQKIGLGVFLIGLSLFCSLVFAWKIQIES